MGETERGEPVRGFVVPLPLAVLLLIGTGGDEVADFFFRAYFSKNGSEGRGDAVEGRPGEMGDPFALLLLLLLLKVDDPGDPGEGETMGIGGGLYPGL